MMENVEELTKRGFTLDMPTTLPVEEERNYGGDRRFGMRPGGSNRGGCAGRPHFASLEGNCRVLSHPESETLKVSRLPPCVSFLRSIHMFVVGPADTCSL